jgi:hypothetical protein
MIRHCLPSLGTCILAAIMHSRCHVLRHCLRDLNPFMSPVTLSRCAAFGYGNGSDDVDALQQRMQVLEMAVSSNLPALHAHLTAEGVLCGMFVPAWFVTMFAKQLPLPMCVRIWDYFLLEGEEFMYRSQRPPSRLIHVQVTAPPLPTHSCTGHSAPPPDSSLCPPRLSCSARMRPCSPI